jgi:SAM-dependent methyltransferase
MGDDSGRGQRAGRRSVREHALARRAETADPSVRYLRADLESLELPEEAYDLAYSSLALHYVEGVGRLVGVILRALVAGGHFVFSIEHPIYMASTSPGWLTTGDGRRIWPVDHYAVEGPRVTDWLAKGVRKQHRTLGATLNTLIDAASPSGAWWNGARLLNKSRPSLHWPTSWTGR